MDVLQIRLSFLPPIDKQTCWESQVSAPSLVYICLGGFVVLVCLSIFHSFLPPVPQAQHNTQAHRALLSFLWHPS